jgi:hypothetical protein
MSLAYGLLLEISFGYSTWHFIRNLTDANFGLQKINPLILFCHDSIQVIVLATKELYYFQQGHDSLGTRAKPAAA